MKISLRTEDTVITATLIDNETTQDFISQLPLTRTMDDVFRREKRAHCPEPFRKRENGRTRTKGDVAYWPPMSQPEEVDTNEILFRPTRQER